MLDLLFTQPAAFILIFGGIIIAIGIHEAAHCFVADYLGDPTPRSLGRTTLNPFAHLDPIGTLAILITGFFGWGKSSPYDPYNLRDPRRDTALIALAGPTSNIVLAIIFSLFIHFIPLPMTISAVVYILIRLNVSLALFNLLPVPPLDGSKIIGLLMSNQSAARYQSQNSIFLLLLLILPIFGGLSIASIIVTPIASFIIDILI